MKNIFWLIFWLVPASLNVWTARGDGTPVAPASQAEVAAGRIGTKFVSPKTMASGTASQQWLTFSSFEFQPSQNVQSTWKFAGTSLTNLQCVSLSPPLFMDTNDTTIRDTTIFKWVDNNGNVVRLMSYGSYGTVTNDVGVARSFDGGNTYQNIGYVNFGPTHWNQWSAKFAVDATNGLLMTVGLGAANSSGPTNNFVCNISTTTFTNFSNLRVLGQRQVNGSPLEQSSGQIIYYNGLYNYFDSVGVQYTNATLGPTGWAVAYSDLTFGQNFGFAGPMIVNFNGLWYWFESDGSLTYWYSTDLQSWKGQTGQPVNYPPYDPPIVILGSWQEGGCVVDNFALPTPVVTPTGTNSLPSWLEMSQLMPPGGHSLATGVTVSNYSAVISSGSGLVANTNMGWIITTVPGNFYCSIGLGLYIAGGGGNVAIQWLTNGVTTGVTNQLASILPSGTTGLVIQNSPTRHEAAGTTNSWAVVSSNPTACTNVFFGLYQH